MKSTVRKVLIVVSALLTIIATVVSSSASAGWAYQPKTPKCLS